MEINVLILGKSGAGKSSLLNYLWGIEKVSTGVGKPVTEKGKTGIHVHDPVKLEGHDLVISDSWGLEADKAEEWLETVMPTLEKHESSPDVKDWFHTVIYCIGASGARIEPFETREVVSHLQKAGHTVIFALTKADRASEMELMTLRRTISEDCPANGGIIDIETSMEMRRNGVAMQQRGKDELLLAITNGLSAKLQHKLATRYLDKCAEFCADWKTETLRRYDNEASFFTRTSKTMEKVANDAETRLRLTIYAIEDWRRQTTETLDAFRKAFGEAVADPESNATLSSRPNVKNINDWDLTLHAANFAMYIIPVVGQIWVFLNQKIHRDILDEKLNMIVKEILADAKSNIPEGWMADRGQGQLPEFGECESNA